MGLCSHRRKIILNTKCQNLGPTDMYCLGTCLLSCSFQCIPTRNATITNLFKNTASSVGRIFEWISPTSTATCYYHIFLRGCLAQVSRLFISWLSCTWMSPMQKPKTVLSYHVSVWLTVTQYESLCCLMGCGRHMKETHFITCVCLGAYW